MTIALLCVLPAFGLPAIGWAQLAEPIRLVDEDLPHAAPAIGDVDGDGTNDLVVGIYRDDPYTGARIRWFRNIGTNASAIYDRGEWLKADGRNASVDEFCHTGAGPQLVDFTGDGRTDLVSGSLECQLKVFDGMANHQFAAAKTLQYAHDPLKRECRYNARLYLFDWDGDNDLDLLVTRMQKIWILPNSGSSLEPNFGDASELVLRQKDEPAFSSSVIADWDDDGRQDLICGLWDGSIVWYRNESNGVHPIRSNDFGKPAQLVGPALPRLVTLQQRADTARTEGTAKTERPAGHVRITVVDYDDDGDLDLIVGDAWASEVARDQQPVPDEAEIAQRKQAREKESVLRRRLEELKLLPSAETESEQQARRRQIEEVESECAAAWRQANAGASFTRHGAVWLIQRR
ncbi:MAG: VCBS repeat-containing protein [Planctomycetales bacterium]|nr:VCBS repeat-containing protein [Planctomycetales bacterium]